jgi:hypothetical protein
MNPDCRDGKHRACAGDGWDYIADEPIPCPCTCHTPSVSIRDLLDQTAFTFVTEDDLQREITTALAVDGMEPRREVSLDAYSRIDLMVGRIGIEVKIGGSWADVVRQLTRYSKHPDIDELILVTTRTRHHHIPTELNGKPVHLVSLIGAAL